MATSASSRQAVDHSACDFAFHAGRLLEQALLEEGCARAKALGNSQVTIEHVQSAFAADLFDGLARRLREAVHAGNKSSYRIDGSRQAA